MQDFTVHDRLARLETKMDLVLSRTDAMFAEHQNTRAQVNRWRGAVAAFTSIGVVAATMKYFGFGG